MNLDEFRVEESPTDLDGARNVCVTLDHVGDHNEIPILNVSTDDVSGNTLEHFYEYLWVNSGYVASRSKDVVTIDIKSLAESFLSAVDIKGVLKDTVTEYVKTKCKTEKKEE